MPLLALSLALGWELRLAQPRTASGAAIQPLNIGQ